MNKIFILFCLLVIGLTSKAQNTFPSSGNVGIGTTSPNKLLHVQANVSGDHSAIIENTSTGGYGLIINSDNDPIRIGSLGNYDGNRFIIKNSGYVGIGVYNPSKTLHVRSTSDNDHSAIIENTSSTGYGLMLNSANDPLRIGSLGNYSGDYLIVKSDGNVGIGFTNPSPYRLAVKSEGSGDRSGIYGEAYSTTGGVSWGIVGRADGSGDLAGIYGWAQTGTGKYAGYFNGNLAYTGTLTKVSACGLRKILRSFQVA